MGNLELGPPIEGGQLETHLPDLLAVDHPEYLVEYGIRVDDGALVFHFFSAKDRPTWNPEWNMHQRLETAIAKSFDVSKVSAGYAEELEAFYIIVFESEGDARLNDRIRTFFSVIDEAPAAS